MAADPKKAKNDNADEAQAPEAGAGNQKKKKLFIMIGIGVLLMGLSIGGTLLAVKMMSSDKKSDDSEEVVDEATEEEETPAAPAIYFTMQPNFTVNFNVDGRQRYLQAEITLLYRNPDVEALLKLHMPAIRNQLVMLLSGKSFDELQNPDSREKLKTESLAAIQSILDKENAALNKKNSDEEDDEEEEDEEESDEEKVPPLVIEQVLFTKFVMQ